MVCRDLPGFGIDEAPDRDELLVPPVESPGEPDEDEDEDQDSNTNAEDDYSQDPNFEDQSRSLRAPDPCLPSSRNRNSQASGTSGSTGKQASEGVSNPLSGTSLGVSPFSPPCTVSSFRFQSFAWRALKLSLRGRSPSPIDLLTICWRLLG